MTQTHEPGRVQAAPTISAATQLGAARHLLEADGLDLSGLVRTAARDRAAGASPQQVEGPYYIDLDDDYLRRDIVEDRVGLPLAVRVSVIDAGDRQPVPGALVDIWHCDALGFYSGYLDYSPDVMPGSIADVAPTDESRFLRGMQSTNCAGVAGFDTIYPGWYFSRAVHIHFRVLIGDVTVYTGQAFLPEEYNRLVSTLPPYSEHTELERIPNERDWPYAEFGGGDTLVDVRPVDPDNPSAGLTASLTLAVVIPVADISD